MASLSGRGGAKRCIVVSQSMYFPWLGMLEQIRLADVFVHYDDVQLTRGFYSRVQVKTEDGMRWLSVPLRGHRRGTRIDEAIIDDSRDWRGQHRGLLRQAYLHAPFREEMLSLVDQVFSLPAATLAQLTRSSIMALVDYFGLRESRQFVCSAELGIGGSGSQRLHDIVKRLGGDCYVTGHGARNYLDHDLFEADRIDVRYMQYRMLPYAQLHGPFTPYVTGLDLVANCGGGGARYIASGAIHWRQFLNEGI